MKRVQRVSDTLHRNLHWRSSHERKKVGLASSRFSIRRLRTANERKEKKRKENTKKSETYTACRTFHHKLHFTETSTFVTRFYGVVSREGSRPPLYPPSSRTFMMILYIVTRGGTRKYTRWRHSILYVLCNRSRS